MRGKRAILQLLMMSSALYLGKIAMAHKGFEEEELAQQAQAAAQEAVEAALSDLGEDVVVTEEVASDLEAAIKAKAVEKKEPFDPVVFAQTHVMETCFMAFFVFCFIICYMGKRHNAAIAQMWHTITLPLIRENFAYVGMDDGRVNVEMEQTSWSEYTFYASGRKNCFYSLYKLDLDKRQCFFSRYLLGTFQSGSDVLTLDIPILFPGGDYDGPPPYPIELFVTQKSRSKAAMDTHEHMKSLLYAVRSKNLPVPAPPSNKQEARELAKKDYLIVLGENEEIANQIIDVNIGEILKKHGDCLYDIHITDQQVYNKYPVFMRARLEIGDNEESMKKAYKVLQAIFSLIDKVVRLKISDQARNACEKNRKKSPSAQVKEAEEQNEQEYLDKLRKQKQEEADKVRKMTPDQRKKYEEKKKKQDLQSQKKRMSKMVKH